MDITKLIVVTVFYLFINQLYSQTVTLETTTTTISENESLTITANLDAPTTQEVVINFDISGTAIDDIDFTANFITKGFSTLAGGNGIGLDVNQLYFPKGITLDKFGDIYIADTGNNRIMKWNPGAPEGIVVAGGNGYGSNLNQLSYPTDVKIDSEGNMYIADSNNRRIVKWDQGAAEGIIVGGSFEDGTNDARLYIDSFGNIFLTEGVVTHSVLKWIPGNQTSITVAGGNGQGVNLNQLNIPVGIDLDSSGNIFIADSQNHRIMKWEPGTEEGIVVAGGNGQGANLNQLNRPNDVQIDPEGNIYIADSGNNRILKWTSETGLVSTVVDLNNNGQNPFDIFVDSNGNIYFTDTGNHRVQKFQISPQIVIPAGQTTGTFSITGVEDAIDENDETIIVTPANVNNATLIDSTPINILLTDLTEPPLVSFELSDEIITENGLEDVILTANLSVVSGKDINIEFITEGTATETLEYALSSNTITIPAGSSIGTLSISTNGLDDTLVEVLETIIFRANNITNAIAETDTITLNLISDDSPSAIFSSNVTTIAEHESVTITATLEAPTSQDVVIDIGLAGTAIEDLDFIADYPGKEGVTVAGGNGQGSALDQLNGPSDIFLDSNDNLLVLDKANGRIQKWAAGANEGITMPVDANLTEGIFVNENGDLYLAGGNSIQKWTLETGVVSTVVNLEKAIDVFLDSDGNIYTSDERSGSILKWVPGSTQSTIIASAAESNLFVDNSGTVFFSRNGGSTVQKWMPGDLEPVIVAANGLGAVFGIFVDAIGNLYVSDDGNSRLQKWAPGGTEGITIAGGNGVGSAANQLNMPRAVFVDSKGDIYVADSGNHRVQKYISSPRIVIPAGQTTGTLSLTGVEDNLNDEGDETIILSAISSENANISNLQDITITLLDNKKTLTLKENPFIGLSDGAVSWGDYDRDGDKDVAVMGQSNILGAVTTIYENQDGNFVDTNQSFTKLYEGDISWVDINSDGWIDLVVSGFNAGTPYTNLYLNNDGQSFTATDDYNLPQLYASKMAWGDLDNDGDVDLAISGIDNQDNFVFGIYYRDNNQNAFIYEAESMNAIPGFINGDLKIIDIDLDGDNDIIYTGENASGIPIGGIKYNSLIRSNSTISGIASLKNSTIEVARMNSTLQNRLSIITSGEDQNGTTVFYSDPILAGDNGAGTELQFPKLKKGDISIGDFNNDGTNDIVLTGEDQNGSPITKLHLQDQNGNFQESTFDLIGLRESTADLVDYDMDGDLDLFITGLDSNGAKTLLYESEIANKKNAPPEKVINVIGEDLGNGNYRFSWDTPNDDYTKQLGYVLRIGTSPGGSEISHPNSNFQTGSRLITAPPTVYTNFVEIQLNPDNYYFSVQAVDTGLKGGGFSDEISFAITYEWKILNQGGIIDKSISGLPSPILKYADIDNDNDLDLIYGSREQGAPLRLYKFNNASNNLSLDQNITFSSSSVNTVIDIDVGDINGDGFVDVITNNDYNGNLELYLSNGSGFDLSILDSGLYKGKARIFDLNNDGASEIIFSGISNNLLSGVPKLFVYEADNSSGSLVFNKTDISGQINSLKFSSFDFGDIDNDQDIDYVISGFNDSSGLQSFIYENITEIGGDILLNEVISNFNSIRDGSTDLIDFDGDGDLDVFLSGTSVSGDVFEVYINEINEGNSNWPQLPNNGLIPMRESKIDNGDFNGDGYSDLLYSGIIEGQGETTKLSEYDPINKRYVESLFDVSMFKNPEFEFGDIDGDGDLDFTIAGEDNNNAGQNIFRTYLNVRNESANVTSKGVSVKGSSGPFVVNTPPSIPTNLSVNNLDTESINSSGVPFELRWQPSTDDYTPQASLTYALKIGTTPGGDEVMSADATENGFRKVVKKGNVEYNISWKLKLLPGTYYATVQAVDASYSGSEFAFPIAFELTDTGVVLDSDSDGDGVMNENDLYPNTPAGETVDANGGVVINPSLINISWKSPTCPSVNNAEISIQIDKNYPMNVKVTGPDGYNEVFNNKVLASPLVLTGLSHGQYQVSFSFTEGLGADIEGYVLNISEAPNVTGKPTKTNNKSKTATFNVSGDSSYRVYVNDIYLREVTFLDNSVHEIVVDNLFLGDNIVKIVPKNACRGIIEQWITIQGDIKFYPNPTQDFVTVRGLTSEEVIIKVFNTLRSQLFNFKYRTEQGVVIFSLENVPSGVYIVKVIGNVNDTVEFKVIKE